MSTPRTSGPDAAPPPVLEVSGLTVAYRSRTGTTTAVQDVDFAIAAGEVVAVVGESGSGKTTTALAVNGLLPPSAGVRSGRILLNGRDISRLPEKRWRQIRGAEIGFVPQDPTVSLNPVQRIGTQVAEALLIHGTLGRRAAAQRAVEILTESGLPDPPAQARQYPHQLSGGMRQRVLIGIALACRPRLVIADEPTSALDVTVQRRILDHWDALIATHGSSVLFITHDLGVAGDRADRILVMHQGRIVEQGTADQILHDPQHAYTRALISAAPSLSAGRMRTSRAKGSDPQPGAVGAPRPDAPAPAAISVTDPTAPAALPASPAGSAPMVVARDLVKEYPHPLGSGPAFRAVDGVSFTIAAGRTLSLVGESGSGKSTVARLLMRLIEPTAGTLEVAGVPLTGVTGKELRLRRRHLQMVYQNPFASLDPRYPVRRIIDEPLRHFGIGDRAHRTQRVTELLSQMDLPLAFADRRPAELSGGQRQRVAIARALALRPDLLVLDEPVSALDVSVQAQILQLLVDLQAELGLTYLFISHDLAVVRQISDSIAVMRGGRIVEMGAAGAILERPEHPYTRELLDAIPGASH